MEDDTVLLPQSRFKKAFILLTKKKLTLFCLVLLLSYFLVTFLVKVGWLSSNWNAVVGASYEAPGRGHCCGTDILGQSVLAKVLHGTEVAVSVGFIVSLLAVTIGSILGIIAGYFGGWVDEIVVWLYTVIAAIPSILLLMVMVFIMGKGMQSICIALVITEWTETCRLVRGEVMQHKVREYIQAATAIGASHYRKLFVHILPNILPLIIYQFSVVFRDAIKREIIFSYLGLGVQDKPSWGIMINDARTELLRGVWWELFFAIVAMFGLLYAFSILADALREALDPKLKGR